MKLDDVLELWCLSYQNVKETRRTTVLSWPIYSFRVCAQCIGPSGGSMNLKGGRRSEDDVCLVSEPLNLTLYYVPRGCNFRIHFIRLLRSCIAIVDGWVVGTGSFLTFERTDHICIQNSVIPTEPQLLWAKS